MKKLLACIDGSSYADVVCRYAAAFAITLGKDVDLLHVLRRHSEYASTADLSGAIGLGARKTLHERLASVDEARGKLDQQKGKLILSHGQEILVDRGVPESGAIHRRGPLVQTIQELEVDYSIIFLGKRGEHAENNSRFLGSNLEKVARGITKPLFLACPEFRTVKRFLIAFDGKKSTKEAVEFFACHPALSHLECHLVSVGKVDSGAFQAAATKLEEAGYSVTGHREPSGTPDKFIAQYIKTEKIDWLAMGAYSHSPLRNLLLGSTSASLILSSQIPMILFR